MGEAAVALVLRRRGVLVHLLLLLLLLLRERVGQVVLEGEEEEQVRLAG